MVECLECSSVSERRSDGPSGVSPRAVMWDLKEALRSFEHQFFRGFCDSRG